MTSPPLPLRRWLVPVLILTAAGVAYWAGLEYFVFRQLPANLIGKWVVEGGEQDGATFDFQRNGAMVGRINVNGREGVIRAQVRVEDDNLFSSTRNPNTQQWDTRRQTIKTLTSTLLVLQDERGALLRLTRAE